MNETPRVPIAVVGVGAILPDAPDATSFWDNVTNGRYCISDVDPERWDPEFYYDADPHALDKTYSKIGGWVREWEWDPMRWKLPVPPKVAEQMDDGQKWAVNCARAALVDYGWPERPIDTERTAVIIGNALAGEKHYQTALRIAFPELAKELDRSPSFAALPDTVRESILAETQSAFQRDYPDITEDTMPGELANVIAGRVSNLFNLRGPNFTSDAACASAMAAMTAGAQGLAAGDFDTVITGGIDRNMGVAAFVKFCKIGALSATGTRPYGEGADGFVMGEGAALFLLKRLAEAERDGDRVYAVIRGIAGSSDGRGKGITAPNPVGQKLAMERAWKAAGLSPAVATLLEGHGTSTRVGDVVEVQAMADVFGGAGAAKGAIALGSVKSNIGHLKGAAGAAGMLKAVLALHHQVLPPSINARVPNPDIDFAHTPMRVNHELNEWPTPSGDGIRRAGVSAFGFGGTNFHAVLEEHVPGLFDGNGSRSFAVAAPVAKANGADAIQHPPAPPQHVATGPTLSTVPTASSAPKPPLRGALIVGAATRNELAERLSAVERDAKDGLALAFAPPRASDLHAAERVAIDYGDAAELAEKAGAALKALALEERADATPMWKALRARGVHRGHGPAPKVAFLYTGQGSQYANMLAKLRSVEPIVDDVFTEADRIMTPLLGRPLSEYIFVDADDPEAVESAEVSLRETEITQPAVMAADLALTRLLAAYGIAPDMVMGHSLGEYGALMTAGSLTFEHTLEAVSARGREMSDLSVEDRGVMAAVFAPLAEVEAAVEGVDGCIVANVNSNSQSVIGGATPAVRAVMDKLTAAEYMVVELPVSHAFHTSIVAPASVPLRAALVRLGLQPPQLPIVSNVTGDLYPTGEGALEKALDLLSLQVASPVQFIAGLRTLYREGARVFVEVGPKRALAGFADDVLGSEPDVVALFTNHPKTGDIISFNQALCGLYAAGLGTGADDEAAEPPQPPTAATGPGSIPPQVAATSDSYYARIGRLVHDVVARESGDSLGAGAEPVASEPVVITGASMGLPGRARMFDDGNVGSILSGDQYIGEIPKDVRDAIVDKHIVRLVKREKGDPTFEAIDNVDEVIKLAARGAALDLVEEFGLVSDRVAAYDRVTALAIGAGLDALRDAGIPFVLRYRTTSVGTLLPDRYMLPEALRDDTGIVFASAFPGYDSLIGYLNDYHNDRTHRALLAELRELRNSLDGNGASAEQLAAVDSRIADAEAAVAREPFTFDRRFLFRALSMGHSQFAELIGARGPNTQVNSACASTTQAMALAEDWIRMGRCRRVVIVAADDATSDNLLEWVASGFLASGAAATDAVVEDAALPFDRRRHGMLLGMGAAGIVIESASAAHERGITPICEQLACVTANSAFHGTRLDVSHISQVMEQLVAQAERAAGIDRHEMARELVFVSHETYTPARGGSAAAEVESLRAVFGDDADKVVVANTKGFTGHPMGVGIEDIVAIKSLETGIVPPVPNFQEPDPELGTLRLSTGGSYPVRYALRLAAGFGSQISMALLRWTPVSDGLRRTPDQLGYAYRISDGVAWHAWLTRLTGRPDVELEVVKRTLRVREESAAPAAPPKPPVEVPAAKAPSVEATPTTHPATAAVTHEPAQKTAAEAAPAPAAVATAPEPAATATAVAEAPAVDEDAIRERVLALVAEKTGYPEDMLDVDLDLEADLGVDTVKQAELFAVIRESYGIERDDTLRLRDLPTLAHVIRFVIDRLPQPQGAQQAAAPSATPPAAAEAVPVPATNGATPAVQEAVAPATDGAAEVAPAAPKTDGAQPSTAAAVEEEAVRQRVLELVAEKTGYPPDMLDVDLDLEADLGVDTVKQAELFAVIRESYGIERDDTLRLRDLPTLAHVIRFVIDRLPQIQSAQQAVAPPAAGEAASVRATNGAARPALEAIAPATDGAAAVAQPVAETNGAQPSTAGAVDETAVRQRVLELVAEKTGYPPDMLDVDLDLEADLGVDTVKQAELFAVIRESYGIERDDTLRLRDLPTLAHVIRFVIDRLPRDDGDGGGDNGSGGGGGRVEPRSEQPVATDGAAPGAAPTVVELSGTPTTVDDGGAATASPAALGEEAVRTRVLELVAEKTGYPPDMLDVDLDLEADLGVDTVKQAELFAVIRESYGIQRDDTLRLRDLPTLAHVIRFVLERASGRAGDGAAAAAPPPKTEEPAPASSPRREAPDTSAADRIPRRVPVAIPRARLELCAPTGVTLGASSRVVIARDGGEVSAALVERLQNVRVTPLVVDVNTDANTLEATLRSYAAAGEIQGVYWLPALDVEPQLADLDLPGWRENLRRRVKQLYTTMRTLDGIGAAGTFLISATRLGGRHGYDAAGATAPMGGAVTGFTKAFARERTDALVKAVDNSRDATPDQLAERLVAETLRDPGAVEVGYALDTRWTVGLEERPAADGRAGIALGPESVVVVTGAAGGIVSAITADLAVASGGTFYLLDLTPTPDRDDPDLPLIDTDREGLKRDLVARLRQGGEKVTPVMVDRRLAAIERQAAALNAIQAVEAAGGTAHYHSVDLTNAAAVAAIFDEIKKRHGRIDVLLHAAGLEISRLLPDKEPKEFDLVFDVKSDGFFTMLHAIGDMPLGASLVFSSVAGRFGNGGQTDYSAANDLLCKVTSSLRSTRPQTRAIAIDWTAWGGIGMATRGSIPKMMELAGIDMLSPEVGIPTVRRELCAGATCGEVVVANRLGILVEERAASIEPGGAPVPGGGPMVDRLVGLGVYEPQVTSAMLDPKQHRFLDDHRIEGTPVLPGVMSMEAFAEAALLPLSGWHIAAVEDIDFLAPFKFYRDEPRTVTVVVRFRSGDGDDELVADCALLGTRTLAGREPQTTTHAIGRACLRRSPGAPEEAAIPGAPAGTPAKTTELYRVYFHGPAYRVLDAAWRERDTVVGRMAAELPADTDNTAGPVIQAPRLAELCFQTAGVRELGVDGVLGLPTHVDAVSALPVDGPQRAAQLHAVARVRDDGRGMDAQVVDGSGHVRLRMRGYRTTPLPMPVAEELLAPFKTAMS